jgi:hypothetical protein
MTARTNRVLWLAVALVLMAMGGVGLSFSFGAWGQGAAHATIITHTVVGWWREGAWKSFAAAAFIGFVFLVLGFALLWRELTPHQGHARLDDFLLLVPDSRVARGETVVKAASLSHGLEGDLETIPGVERALVGLFGTTERLAIRVRLRVRDSADLEEVSRQVAEAVGRMARTGSLHTDDVEVTVSLVEHEIQVG